MKKLAPLGTQLSTMALARVRRLRCTMALHDFLFGTRETLDFLRRWPSPQQQRQGQQTTCKAFEARKQNASKTRKASKASEPNNKQASLASKKQPKPFPRRAAKALDLVAKLVPRRAAKALDLVAKPVPRRAARALDLVKNLFQGVPRMRSTW